MTWDPVLVTENRSVPDGAVAAETLHSLSDAVTASARGSAFAPGVIGEVSVLSVHAARSNARAHMPAETTCDAKRERLTMPFPSLTREPVGPWCRGGESGAGSCRER